MLIERKEVLNEDGSVGYIEAIFKSENILKTTYFKEAQRLYIAFNRGGTYSYENVSPELYEQFENAESQGKFFIANIKNHPYRKEFTLYPGEIKEVKKIIEEKTIEEDE
jgi:hypothetical protein